MDFKIEQKDGNMVRPYYNYERVGPKSPPPLPLRRRMTPVVRNLMIVNVVVFLLQLILGNGFTILFGLTPNAWSNGMYWQLLTYMFLHSPGFLLHLLTNMLALYLLGPEVERGMGGKHFLVMYLISGILGGAGWLLLNAGGLCIGASGAVMGMLASFAALYPKQRLAFIFLPMFSFKAWQVVVFFGGLELLAYLFRPDSSIAHTVHLAGGVAGCFYTLAVFKPQLLHTKWLADKLRGGRGAGTSGQDSKSMTPRELDAILDKISRDGMSSLTKHERNLLDRASEKRKSRR